MHIKELLENYTSNFIEENLTKNLMLNFLSSCNNAFDRSNINGHFTASAFVLNKDKTKFLLMHHRKLNQWFQPGGHADGDSDLLKVAIKETLEESGISSVTAINEDIYDIDVHLIPANSTEAAHYHYDVRFLLQSNDDTLVKNEESNALEWVSLNSYEKYSITTSVLRMIKKYTALSSKVI
jgi:8-oxo-dGTP pyrophosphatase MutT (NUDIX family)